MANITVTFEVPDIAREFFTTFDFNPFETSQPLSVKLDRDNLTRLLFDLLQEVRYQKQRDEKTFQSIGLGAVEPNP